MVLSWILSCPWRAYGIRFILEEKAKNNKIPFFYSPPINSIWAERKWWEVSMTPGSGCHPWISVGRSSPRLCSHGPLHHRNIQGLTEPRPCLGGTTGNRGDRALNRTWCYRILESQLKSRNHLVQPLPPFYKYGNWGAVRVPSIITVISHCCHCLGSMSYVWGPSHVLSHLIIATKYWGRYCPYFREENIESQKSEVIYPR